MSEFTPNPEKEYESIFLHLGETKLSFEKDKGFGFKHEEPKHDHVWVVLKGGVEKPEQSVYFFRELFEHHGVDMDEFLDYMEEMEFYVAKKEKASDEDLEMYEYWSADGKTHAPLLVVPPREPSTEIVHVPKEVHPIPNPEEEWGNTKKAQAEKWGQFVAYLAESIANGEREE